MNQDEVIALVNSTGVAHELGTRQQQHNQARFFHAATDRSLNLGFHPNDAEFVADFVFKGKSMENNLRDCEAFIRLFGGTRPDRPTAFARLQPKYTEGAWLVQVIQGYWAMGRRGGA